MQLPLQFIAARTSDPATSQANRDAYMHKMSQRDLLLMTYYNFWKLNVAPYSHGMTDEEVGSATILNGESMYAQRACYWKRCSELRKNGFIRATGETRISSAGQMQQVCEITQEGIDHVESHLLK
jgi:hypothetical protein